MSVPKPFADRTDAGRRLAAALTHLSLDQPVVVALPRGGVPVAREVADALGAPLEVMLVRKLGAPGQPEYAMGAVAEGPEPLVALNPEVMDLLRPSNAYVKAETERQLAEIARRRQRLLGSRAPMPLEGRTVVVVDDGAATGATMRVALKAARIAGARRVVAALPVVPPDVARALRHDADEVICLMTPEPFVAVGNFYENFDQVTDEEVAAILARSAVSGGA